ncbi:Stp1/IreP family PP2C-type Ser/Thr phosphatase [Thermodesulfobacteriota bacterium]
MTFVTIGTASHPGMRKAENEDALAYFSPEEGRQHKKGLLLALADGMGGRRGGAIASKIAVELLMEEYYKDYFNSIPDSLQQAFFKVNTEVIAKGQADWNLEGMATTLTAVVLKDDKLYYAHVGDSRAYIIYNTEILPLTEDHSYVASLVKAGAITEEQALTHPQANIITKAIGISPELSIDISREHLNLQQGQYILICCDGLYKVVPEKELLEIVNEYPKPDVACEKLVEKANEYGGPDNITVLVARVDKINLLQSILRKVMNPLRGNRK